MNPNTAIMTFIQSCEKLFEEISTFEKQVNIFTELNPRKCEVSEESVENYLDLLNFLWTEYEFLYNGSKISKYRLDLYPNGMDFLYHDNVVKKKKRFWKKLIKKKRKYLNTL